MLIAYANVVYTEEQLMEMRQTQETLMDDGMLNASSMRQTISQSFGSFFGFFKSNGSNDKHP